MVAGEKLYRNTVKIGTFLLYKKFILKVLRNIKNQTFNSKSQFTRCKRSSKVLYLFMY
jgi:hypothetical protein